MKTWVKHLGMLALLLVMLVAGGCQSPSEQQASSVDTQVITDSIGREVTVPKDVRRVAVANAYNTEIINALGVIDRVIGVDGNIYQDQGGYGNRFGADAVIGKSQRELNYEKIIELNPQVLILTGNGAVQEATEKLEPFGIAVLVVDAYYTDQFGQTCDIMGKLFNKEQEAAELKHFFLDKLDYIQQQLKDVPKRSVYFEYRRIGNTTVPGDYFYWMVEYSGAHNIFREAQAVAIDPEQVVVLNPSYIVKVSDPISKSNYIPPTKEKTDEIKAELVGRPGWDEIDAVKNDRILLLSHYVHGGASKLVGTMYIAKYMYPEYLPDLHPEEVFKTWLEKYQHLEYISGHTVPAFTLEQ